MKMVNVHEAKSTLSRLIEEVTRTGQAVVIARAGRPVAQLVPVIAAPAKRKLGTSRGKLVVSDDFDAGLPEETVAGFEGQP
jgi:prevent-host-death family protein